MSDQNTKIESRRVTLLDPCNVTRLTPIIFYCTFAMAQQHSVDNANQTALSALLPPPFIFFVLGFFGGGGCKDRFPPPPPPPLNLAISNDGFGGHFLESQIPNDPID